MNRYALPVVGFALLIVAFVFGLQNDPRILPSPFIGKPAPRFDLPDLHDFEKRVSNADFEGKAVLVNFWATWCVGCRQEHAFLNRLSESAVIPIYGINWRDNRDEALRWLQDLGNPYIASGYDGSNHTGLDWGVYGAPETFLIDASGVVLYRHTGPLNQQIWQQVFVPLIQPQGNTS